MSEQNNNAQTAPPVAVKSFAVIQTGYVTKGAEPIVFKDELGNRTPQVVRIFSDRETADRIRNRLAVTHSKVSTINGKPNYTSTPLYAVAEVEGPVHRIRKPMTAEQKAAFVARTQAGRKKGKGK